MLQQDGKYYITHTRYRAPEILIEKNGYSFKSDVWAVGTILGEMIVRKPLFPGKDYLSQLELIFSLCNVNGFKISTEKPINLDDIPNSNALGVKKMLQSIDVKVSLDETTLNFLSNILSINPNKRPTAQEALCMKYLEEYHDQSTEPTSLRIMCPDSFIKNLNSKIELVDMLKNEIRKVFI